MSATIVTEVPKSDPRTAYGSTNGLKRDPASSISAGSRDALIYALVDILLVSGSAFLAYHVRFSSDLLTGLAFRENLLVPKGGLATAHFAFLLLYVALLVTASYAQDLYRPSSVCSPLTDSILVIRAVLFATLILAAFIYLSGTHTISRFVVGLSSTSSVIVLTSWRLARGYVLGKRRARGYGLRHALIVGAGTVGRLLATHLEQKTGLGYKVRGFLDRNRNGDPRVLGDIADLVRVAREEFVDDVFITIPSERELVKRVALEARRLRLNVKVVPEFYDGLAWLSPIELVGEFPVRVLHREPIPTFGLLIKRLLDIIGSTIGLILLSPVLAMIALATKLDSPGPVFYRAYRVGRKGREFLCYKFRTMVSDADKMKDQLRHLNQRVGPLFKIANDPRLTRLGAFLRRYSLDELPQLWNVLRGDMSLIGPRPPEPGEITEYSLEHLRRLDVTPGITGLWQVTARRDPSFEKAVLLDNQYIENWSLLLDLKILLKTIPAVLRGTGH